MKILGFIMMMPLLLAFICLILGLLISPIILAFQGEWVDALVTGTVMYGFLGLAIFIYHEDN